MQIFDAQTGARVESLPQVPAGALAFVTSPDGERAVIVSKAHAVVLWDVAAQREIAVLESENAQLNQVAFSPDGTLVAVVTIHKNSGGYSSKFLLRIWNAQTGALLQNGHFIANSAGKIREWNLQNVLAQIALFEESLTVK